MLNNNNGLKCTHGECRERLKSVKNMSFEELDHYATHCATCGNWILKDDPTAHATYTTISIHYAEKFNERMNR